MCWLHILQATFFWQTCWVVNELLDHLLPCQANRAFVCVVIVFPPFIGFYKSNKMVEGSIIVIFCKRTHETKLNLQRFQTSIKSKYSSCVFSHTENWNLSVLPLWNFTLKAKLKSLRKIYNVQCGWKHQSFWLQINVARM